MLSIEGHIDFDNNAIIFFFNSTSLLINIENPLPAAADSNISASETD